jgi:hypothetical protein
MNKQTSTHEEELKQLLGAQKLIDIAAVAAHSFFAYGKGIVQLSNTGNPESYIIEEQITDKQHKAAVMSYNPFTTVLVLYPVAQENIFVKITPETSLGDASTVHKIQRTRKDGLYYGTNSTRLIRLADIKFNESILQVALEITEKLHSTLTLPYRRDVLQLAIRLIGQAQTLYHLGSPSVSPVPRLGGRKPVVDISSVSSIFRTIIETFLTMHEVFFEPKDDNDFEFYHSRWMLVGLHNIKKHTHEAIYNAYAPEEVEPMRIDATNRIKKTTQYQEILSKKKNNHEKTMAYLVRRNRDDDEWQRIAQSANIDAPAYQKLYTAYSGYIHSDGYTSFQLDHQDEFEFDYMVEVMLHHATRIVSKMIFNFAERYESVDQIAKGNMLIYQSIKSSSRKLSGD